MRLYFVVKDGLNLWSFPYVLCSTVLVFVWMLKCIWVWKRWGVLHADPPFVLIGSVFSSTRYHGHIVTISCPSSGISDHGQSLIRWEASRFYPQREEKKEVGKGRQQRANRMPLDWPVYEWVQSLFLRSLPVHCFLALWVFYFLTQFLLYSSHVIHVISSIPVAGPLPVLLSGSVFFLVLCNLNLLHCASRWAPYDWLS